MSEVKKTIADWVELFPEPYKSQAKEFEDKTRWREHACDQENVVLALFVWSRTPQGYFYWSAFQKKFSQMDLSNQDPTPYNATMPTEKRYKLIPFDIEKAETANRIVTRDGLTEIIEWYHFKRIKSDFPLAAIIDCGENIFYTISGTYYGDNSEHPKDLFMEVEQVAKEYWIATAVYGTQGIDSLMCTNGYGRKEDAIAAINPQYIDSIQTHKIIRYE